MTRLNAGAGCRIAANAIALAWSLVAAVVTSTLRIHTRRTGNRDRKN